MSGPARLIPTAFAPPLVGLTVDVDVDDEVACAGVGLPGSHDPIDRSYCANGVENSSFAVIVSPSSGGRISLRSA